MTELRHTIIFMQCRTAHLTIRELLSPVCCIFSPLSPPDNDVFNDPESLLKTLTVEKGENACTALSLFFFFTIFSILIKLL